VFRKERKENKRKYPYHDMLVVTFVRENCSEIFGTFQNFHFYFIASNIYFFLLYMTWV
jgi:hypothetical protein